MLEAIERQTGPEPEFTVIWLHGLGADGSDFVPLVPELVRPHWPALRFVFPHAPVRAVTINRGMRMRAWYDILTTDFTGRREDADGVRDAMLQVDALLAREGERGIAPERVVIAGFSQGAAIALACALTQPLALAGTIALSGYLPLASEILAGATPAGLSTPVFMAHGSMDPVVPLALGERSREQLVAAGARVDWRTYPMPHSVCPEEVTDLADWLEPRLVDGS